MTVNSMIIVMEVYGYDVCLDALYVYMMQNLSALSVLAIVIMLLCALSIRFSHSVALSVKIELILLFFK